MEENKNQNCTLLSAKALAKMLSISVRSIWRYRSAQRLPEPVKVGGAIRWRQADINLFLDCNCDMSEFQARKEAQNEK